MVCPIIFLLTSISSLSPFSEFTALFKGFPGGREVGPTAAFVTAPAELCPLSFKLVSTKIRVRNTVESKNGCSSSQGHSNHGHKKYNFGASQTLPTFCTR